MVAVRSAGDRSLALVSNCRFSEVAKAQCRKPSSYQYRQTTYANSSVHLSLQTKTLYFLVAAVLVDAIFVICVIDPQFLFLSNIKAHVSIFTLE